MSNSLRAFAASALLVASMTGCIGAASDAPAFDRINNASRPLRLVGDGPMAATVREAAAKDAAIRWLGNMPLDAIYGVLGAAKLLVLPSQCYETLARVAIEAFAKGTPVIGSRLGAMVEIVDEDAIDLAEKVRHRQLSQQGNIHA